MYYDLLSIVKDNEFSSQDLVSLIYDLVCMDVTSDF